MKTPNKRKGRKPHAARDPEPGGDSAKVRRPRAVQVYARRRLFRALDGARERHRVVWIAGPPGAGKTTLASSYVEARKLACLWYRIDDSDRDLASFFHYLTQAARVALPRGRKPLPRLTPEHLPTVGLFARRYFQALFARFRQPVLLVFDDYHALPPDSPLHAVLREGLADLPPAVHALFVSREDPPPALARWQVHRHMTLLGAHTLKLSLDELAGIARRLRFKRPGKECLRRIHELAGGWTAGAALLLRRGRGERADAVEPAAPQVLFDYFAGEIFHHMDADTQRVLLESALLPTMSAAAVLQLTGEARGAAVLADLAHRNYFTMRGAKAAATYQFHALFRGFLLRELKATYPPERLRAVQCRAAALLEAEGRIEDAVEVLRDAAAWDELARVIVAVAPALAAQARLDTLENWIGLLPANPADGAWLLYWRAQCRMMSSPAEAHELSERAFARFEQTGDAPGLYLSWSSGVAAITADWINFQELDRWLQLFDALQRRHPAIPAGEAEARVTIGMVSILTNLPTARPDRALWVERATQLVHALPDPNQRLLLGATLVYYYIFLGDRKALTGLIEALEPVQARDDVAPIAAIAWRVVSAIYYWISTARPDKTIEIVDAALHLSETSGARAADAMLRMQGVYAALLLGDIKRAAAYAARMRDSRPETGPVLATFHHASASLAAYRNDLDQAHDHARRALALVYETGGALQRALAHIDLGWVLHKLAKPAEAREHLEQARNIWRTMGSATLEYCGLMAEASAALDRDERDAVLEPLRAALALDKQIGGFAIPQRPPGEIARLCAIALDHGIEVEHVRAVIRKRKLVPESPPLEVEHWPWPYRLYTLGRFSVVKDDKPLSLSGKGRKKPLELLKTLVALGGRDVSQQKLTEAQWPDADGDAAQHAFETALYRLRKLLGDETALVLKDGRLSLDARVCWVDCWAFERLLSKVEDLSRHGSVAGIEPVARKLFGLYRGPFLDREADVAPALLLRERLRSRFLRALQECAHLHERERDWEKAIACYQHALEVEPLAEALYQNLMKVYHALERHAEACAVYERCKTALRSMLGVAPSPETESLRQSLETVG